MSTYSLTLRNVKGSALTYTELDDNFLYLENMAGSAGVAGSSGTSGISGSSGTSGNSGSSGTSGQDGSSGTSGISGSSGTSGQAGSSGTSGQDGSSGTSGISGSSGTSGIGISGSSGTSGQDGSSGTSGNSGSSGTSGQDGSSGTSGIGLSGSSGTSGSSGQTGSSGTSGSGSGGLQTFNYRTSTSPIGTGFITHNNTNNMISTTLTFNTTHNQLFMTGFILEQTITIDAIGMFGGGGNNFTASVAAAIYDARTASISFASAQVANNLSNLMYHPNNLITTATFSANPPTSTEWLGAGLFFKPLSTPVQLQANTPYFIGSYGSASQIGGTTTWAQGCLTQRPNLGFASPTLQNGTNTHFFNALSGFYTGTTFSTAYPFTIATNSFPSVMPEGAGGLTVVGGNSNNMRFLAMRILSIP